MDDKSFVVRVPKRWVRVGLVAVITALIVAPLTALATHNFNDVPDGNTFHDDIAWMESSGITRGCNPPDNDEYCPDDPVTREQMAAFMHRFAEGLTPRAAFAAEDQAPDGQPYTLSTEITAPAPGIILTNGAIDAFSGPDSIYSCRILLNGEMIPGSRMDSSLTAPLLENPEENCATGGGVAVDAGEHTISLDVFNVNGGTAFWGAHVSALWVPHDGTGAVPTSFTQLGDLGAVTEEKPTE